MLLQRYHSQSTPVKHVEAAVLEKSLVAAAAALLEDAHGYEDGRIGTAVLLVLALLGEQRTEYFFVYV